MSVLLWWSKDQKPPDTSWHSIINHHHMVWTSEEKMAPHWEKNKELLWCHRFSLWEAWVWRLFGSTHSSERFIMLRGNMCQLNHALLRHNDCKVNSRNESESRRFWITLHCVWQNQVIRPILAALLSTCMQADMQHGGINLVWELLCETELVT